MTAEMVEPSNGLVISYNYLWAREYDRREESGRKVRPACVQIIIARGGSGTVVALFPITRTRRVGKGAFSCLSTHTITAAPLPTARFCGHAIKHGAAPHGGQRRAA